MKHGAAASLLNVHFQISCADGDVLEEPISLDLKLSVIEIFAVTDLMIGL
jgi:hypothetical protein